jgi:LmbE family N-acetylglucosaminyl deacetylase
MSKKKILILEPHSDDSCYSSGGFLKKYENDYEYYFRMMISSDIKLLHANRVVTSKERLEEYKNYAESFKNGHVIEGRLFDCESRADTIPLREFVGEVERTLAEIKPDILIIQGDSYHQDHHVLYKACLAAMRPCGLFMPDTVLIGENATYMHKDPTNIELQPNTYCSLTKELVDHKVHLINDYFPSQVRPNTNYLSTQGIIDWAKYRGIESRCDYAEGFYELRRMI